MESASGNAATLQDLPPIKEWLKCRETHDYGYDDIFSRQLEALANSNDTLIVYTTSGKSKNIINLVNKAKPMVSSIIALTGCYTQELEEQCDEILSVNSSQTTKIQEAHAIIGHVLCECVEEALFTK